MTNHTDPSASERSAENVIHRIWATEGTRILIGVIAVLLGLAWNNIKDEMADVKKNQDASAATQSDIKSDIRNINTRLDEGIIKQVGENKEGLRKLEERVTRLENKVRIP